MARPAPGLDDAVASHRGFLRGGREPSLRASDAFQPNVLFH